MASQSREIDQMELILQIISQKGSLLKLILNGIFFLKAFRQKDWRNTAETRYVTDSPIPLARHDSVRLIGDTAGTRGNRQSVFRHYE